MKRTEILPQRTVHPAQIALDELYEWLKEEYDAAIVGWAAEDEEGVSMRAARAGAFRDVLRHMERM